MDLDGVKHSVEITAGSLFEGAVVGMNAMRVPGWFKRSTLTIEIRVKQPETIHTVSNTFLTACLARKGRTPREMALKSRLLELVGLTKAVGLKRTTLGR
jgi:hypothetical protein